MTKSDPTQKKKKYPTWFEPNVAQSGFLKNQINLSELDLIQPNSTQNPNIIQSYTIQSTTYIWPVTKQFFESWKLNWQTEPKPTRIQSKPNRTH